MAQLLIAPQDLAAVEEQARAAFPAECCGLLVGRRRGGGRASVGRVEACVNRSVDRDRRFTISPEALLATYRRARDRGEQVLGTYHSHPGSAAVPSESDRESAWPGASYLIVGLDGQGVRERRSWRLDEQSFIEEELIVHPVGEEEP